MKDLEGLRMRGILTEFEHYSNEKKENIIGSF